MKYWWLEKYKNFKIIQVTNLEKDINYFLTMPKNYEKKYELLKDIDINALDEEDLLILLKKIVSTKNIKNNSLSLIINKLLLIPDNSFPKSDYTLIEMLDEIKKLKTNYPFYEKLDNNNIAICYNCLNIYYVDKIKSVNKKNLCVCPFCLKSKLYFDNDYIPMNYTFIKLASIYYNISKLGCTFREVKKIVKKNLMIIDGNKDITDIDITDLLSSKVYPIDEKIINKKLYDMLMEKEEDLEHSVTLYIKKISKDIDIKILILLVSIIEILSNCVYLREIIIKTDNEVLNINLKKLKKEIIDF